MKIKKPLLTIFLFALLLYSCDKSDFKEYTMTDKNGVIMGDEDLSDWTNDLEWAKKIEKHIEFECSEQVIGNSISVEIHPAYPNPVRSSFFFTFNSDPCVVKLVMVDKRNNVLFQNCIKNEGGWKSISISAAGLNLKSSEFYRLYYYFSNTSKDGFYKGHGDILIE